MKELLLVLATTLIRQYIGSGLFDRVAALVLELISSDIPGEEKKNKVREFVAGELGILKGVEGLSEWWKLGIDVMISLTRLTGPEAKK